MAAPDLVEEALVRCRPFATGVSQEIAEFANTYGTRCALYAGLSASLVLQNIFVSIAVQVHAPGSKEGEEWLKDNFEGVLQDALLRWRDPKLAAMVEAAK